MSHLHALNGHDSASPAGRPAGPDTVKNTLTPNRAGRAVENDEYAAFARRVLRAYARRVADGDVEALILMFGLAAEIDDRHHPGRQGPARLRLLLGRDRLPARRHPPGRPATLGPPGMTAATAALGPEPHHGLGTWGDRRRHRDHLLGRLPRLGTPARQLRRLLAPDPAARPHRRHRPDHRRDRPRLRHRRRARGSAARRLRQPPRDRLPGLLGGVQARRPAARPRRPGRRQGHPRDDHRAPVRVRHPHRAVVRPGPLPPDARQDRAALPTPPRRQDAPLPARPGHLLPDPARRGRSPARPADVRRLLRLHRRRAVQRLGRGSCGAGSPPTCPATWPAAWASPRNSSAPWYESATSRWPNTRPAASSTSTP